ncbi:Bug family tripartite tricarboxylate transporter substrate binding protein [Pollutimonas harenae]|uniref:Tripartite tricarboxylate transporter substrate binding protein n=1 Tax=Pollutimonas harenae TaxID=657015 RepID=A0A853H3V3_9BURK|nr:tripartite tricarboxylate transporter substrate binding protein [Pollutimonas harenae]NYT84814.1 tripartite tricarboxylate transporter substrate binding protein [Pollutimonas harenae]TEA72788.1 tripartite tricarboxylate transporter substrate binding protein [Pollutimonas harenae]
MRQRLYKLGAMLGLALGLSGMSMAASFPDGPVNLVVNYGAGGNTDVASRQLASGMEEFLKQSIVVVNKPGAMGTMGPTYLTRQKNDGYTFGVVTYSTVAIAPHLMSVPYTIDDFEFVAGFGRFRYGVAVRADSPYKNIQDLVDGAKKGDGLFFGAPSAPNNLAIFELAKVSGGKFEQILYKSGAETVIGLLSGQVDVIVQNPSDILPHIAAGKIRMLASASPIRWPEQPDVPTIKEQGFPVEIDSWLGLAVPKGTSPDHVKVLESATLAAMNEPKVQENFKAIGVDPAGLTGAEYKQALADGYEIMGKAIKDANLPRVN